MFLTNFEKKVLKTVSLVPIGKVTTYKDIALFVGNSKASRAVGNALNKNPDINKIPCFRVVKKDGRVGGFVLGSKKKIEFLEKEGVKIKNGKIESFDKVLYNFS
jgi:O-6-methylguanine DNA methyltransferase